MKRGWEQTLSSGLGKDSLSGFLGGNKKRPMRIRDTNCES